jgi:hypothetical protein
MSRRVRENDVSDTPVRAARLYWFRTFLGYPQKMKCIAVTSNIT